MKTYTTQFPVFLPATKTKPPQLIETIEVDCFKGVDGEETLTHESSERIEKIKRNYLRDKGEHIPKQPLVTFVERWTRRMGDECTVMDEGDHERAMLARMIPELCSMLKIDNPLDK